ncbi:hypothetical protein HK101_002975 [Irineochytrium annulatum]|nr:hypothetical protein HK101_002975 [Irineochytrium annulatum]
MRSEAIVQAKIRQRRCWFWACVGTWGVIIALLVIIIPVFIKVIIPWMITDGFAHGTSKSASPIQVQVVGLSNFTAAGATGNFSAYANGVGVPLNIPIHMMPGSYWNFRVLEAANGSQPAGWTDMVTMGDYVGDAWIRDNVVSTTSSGFDIAVAGGGKALAALVAGLSQVFIKGASAVPTMNINIIADFMVGSLFYPKLNLARSVNIGEWLTVATFTGPTTGPTANVQASSFAFQPDGSILTGLSINLPPTTPTPLGFNLTQIKFNLTLDERTLARCTIPRLAFTAGDTRLIIPLLFHPVAANKTLSVEDGALVAIYGSAKYIGANAVSALDENGTAVPWLDEVAAAIDFQFPRSDLEAASNTVVGSWIISVALSSLGITNAPSLNLTAVPR